MTKKELKKKYFSHDLNARKDPKLDAFTNEFGAEGLGFYWCLVEMLHEQMGKISKFPKLIEYLSKEFKIEINKTDKMLNSMINDYDLLKEDENYLYNERVLRNIIQMQESYEAKSKAGKKGMEIRWNKDNSVITDNNNVITDITNININKNKIKTNKDIPNEVITHFNEKTGKSYKLTAERQRVIQSCINKGRSVEQIKMAIEEFSYDDWKDRGDFCDLVYAIGVRNKVDNFERWFEKAKKGEEQWNQQTGRKPKQID